MAPEALIAPGINAGCGALLTSNRVRCRSKRTRSRLRWRIRPSQRGAWLLLDSAYMQLHQECPGTHRQLRIAHKRGMLIPCLGLEITCTHPSRLSHATHIRPEADTGADSAYTVKLYMALPPKDTDSATTRLQQGADLVYTASTRWRMACPNMFQQGSRRMSSTQ